VTGVINKQQQHEILHTIGVYQQLVEDVPAFFGQQKLFKNLPKCKVNISLSNRQQGLKLEHKHNNGCAETGRLASQLQGYHPVCT
jgi:hypothetical protein